MTLTPHGYPDWQRQVSVADVFIWEENGVNITGAVTRGPFFVGNSPALGVSLVAGSGRFLCAYDFFRDQALLNFMGSTFIRVSPDGSFTGGIPVHGPWVRQTLTNEAAGAGNFTQLLWLQRHIGMRHDGAAANLLIVVTPQNVAAGATLTTTATLVYPAAASLSYRTTAAANSINLQFLNDAGVWSTFFSRGNQLVLDPSLVFLPATPIRMQCVNNDAGARAFEAYLLAEPHFTRT